MKIEKLNDSQLRATLTGEDLMRRQIRFSEFAYGTEAVHALFNEVLRFANYKLGFELDDSPIMVEAIPVSSDSIVMLVTKTSYYLDELDTHFAKFSDAPNDEDYLEYSDDGYLPYVAPEVSVNKATDILDTDEAAAIEDAAREAEESAKKVGKEISPEDNPKPLSLPQRLLQSAGFTQKGKGGAAKGVLASALSGGLNPGEPGRAGHGKAGIHSASKGEDGPSTLGKKGSSDERFTRCFCMNSLDEVLEAAKVLGSTYHGDNSLYRTGRGYELVARIGDHTPQEFNRVVNVLSEYGSLMDFKSGAEDYYKEHTRLLVEHGALQALKDV